MRRVWRFSIEPVVVAYLLASMLLGIAAKTEAQTPTLNWQPLSPVTAPSPRAGHKLVYDRTGAKVLLFGGQSPSGALFNDVWEFDMATGVWTEVTPSSGPAPSPRARFGMAIDELRGVVVVYGGFVGGSPGTSDETWEWNLAAGSWAQRANAGIIDYAGRIGAELAFDPNLQMVILFGGLPYWVCPTNGGTYAWNGTSWQLITWDGPSGRVAHAMATEWGRSRVVMYGGAGNFDCNSNTELTDTWEWDGLAWTKLADAPNRPDTNRGVAMVFDPTVNGIVSFGGYVSQQSWLWDGVSWSSQTATNAPVARVTALAFDEAANTFVLFGGSVGGFPLVWPTGLAGGVGDTHVAARQVATTLTVDPVSVPFQGGASGSESPTLRATLVAGGSPLEGKTVGFAILGAPVGSAVTDANGVVLMPLPVLQHDVGTYAAPAVFASFESDGQYAGSEASAELVVTKAAPAVTWFSPLAIVYGTSLDDQQLHAAASVPGTFSYAPSAGTILPAGVHSLGVTFTPEDTTRYETVGAYTVITVTKVTPVITWPQPNAIVYGTALGSAQLNAQANVAGAFTYSPPAGLVLLVGGTFTLSANFVPFDTANYFNASASVPLVVTPASTTTTLSLSSTSVGVGEPLTMTATLSTLPVGNVGGTSMQFWDGGTLLGSATLFGSQGVFRASLTRTFNQSGSTHALTARFAGNASFAASSSDTLSSSVTPAAFAYALVDLGTLGGPWSEASGVNQLGQVVGTSPNTIGHSRAFLYENGAMHDIGTLGGLSSRASGINNEGEVVGSSQIAPSGPSHAFRWKDGVMQDLGTLGGADSSALAINDAGDVVGFSFVAAGSIVRHAFLYRNGTMIDLGTLGGTNSFAVGVDAAGRVIAYSDVPGDRLNERRTFIWHNGVRTDIGTMGGTVATASSVNPLGHIVGESSTSDGFSHAFVYAQGVFTDLGVISSGIRPHGINDSGDVVGYSQWLSFSEQHATIRREGLIFDANIYRPMNSPWSYLAWAQAINDDGLVVGFGYRTGAPNMSRAFLLSPQDRTTLTLTDAEARYGQAVSLSARLTVGSASGVAGKDITFNVNGQRVGSTVTDAAGVALFSVTGLGAGAYVASASFTSDLDLTGSAAEATLTITPAAPVIAWATPADVLEGTVLGPGQLNATAAVPGTFVYSPLAGTVLTPGTHTLTATFTPQDVVNYTSTTVSVSLIVASPITTTVVSPNGGEKVFGGSPYLITWTGSGGLGGTASFDLFLSLDSGVTFTPLTSCAGLAGTIRSCLWPSPGPATSKARVRVVARDTAGNMAMDVSNADFTINTQTPSLSVTAPGTGTVWPAGSAQLIKWSHNLGVGALVRIESSVDAGATWTLVANSVASFGAGSGEYSWTVPNSPSTSATIRINWLSGQATGTSGLFTISQPQITVTVPTAGTVWAIGKKKSVKWSHNLPSGTPVVIDVSRDGGTSWSVIGQVSASGTSGSFDWIVTAPSTTTDGAVLRVRTLDAVTSGRSASLTIK